MPRLPNFFIAGAPRAGTTSLYEYLDQHPQVFMSAIKEPHYFAAEIRPENCAPDLRQRMAREKGALRKFLDGPMAEKRTFGGIVNNWDDYVRLFANATTETALGEASVCYLWSPTAAAGIAERIPGAKILIMLRDPAERAFSQYLHGLGNGAISWSFREHIERNLRNGPGPFSVHYPFLEFGLYAEQVCRYLTRFGKNVWIGFYEDFKEHPEAAFEEICRFLDIAPEFAPDMSRRHLESQVPRIAAVGWLKRSGLWQSAAHLTPKRLRPFLRRSLVRRPGTTHMDPEDRRLLVEFYSDDIRKLAAMLERNLDAWLE